MIKYAAVGAAFKVASRFPRVYHYASARMGSRRRAERGLNEYYMERAERMLALCAELDVGPGDRLLQLGTGWMHWESIIVTLFYEVDEIVLYDVVDNRQMDALKRTVAALADFVEEVAAREPARDERARHLLGQIADAPSFDALYDLLNFTYLVEPCGALNCFPADEFDLVFSCDVMEHVSADILPTYVPSIARVLKPGGVSVHWIDTTDHLAKYTRTMSPKTFLRFPDRMWRFLFENNVQYFNRVQRSTWLKLFADAGLELVSEDYLCEDAGAMHIHQNYGDLEDEDLDCRDLEIIHRKPMEQG